MWRSNLVRSVFLKKKTEACPEFRVLDRNTLTLKVTLWLWRCCDTVSENKSRASARNLTSSNCIWCIWCPRDTHGLPVPNTEDSWRGLAFLSPLSRQKHNQRDPTKGTCWLYSVNEGIERMHCTRHSEKAETLRTVTYGFIFGLEVQMSSRSSPVKGCERKLY